MDSVTQIALGAAVGEATLGRQVGNRAVLWGGICGLFPDLDVLYPFSDPVKAFTYHRGMSHSIFVLSLLTPLFVWLILKLHPQTDRYRNRWGILVFLAFVTHILLDCCTVYGTQILWPLPTPPVMWSTIFIIDPIYSLPLFIGVLSALILSRKTRRGHRMNTVCMTLSTLYLIWGVGVKWHIENVAHAALEKQNIQYQEMLTIPAPFNTVLWRILVMDEKGYYEGYRSLFDTPDSIRFRHYPSDKVLLKGLEDHWPVQRLEWFTHGFYAVRQIDDDLIMADLRMGWEPSYVFQFKVGETGNPHAVPVQSERIRTKFDRGSLHLIWKRIWGEALEAF